MKDKYEGAFADDEDGEEDTMSMPSEGENATFVSQKEMVDRQMQKTGKPLNHKQQQQQRLQRRNQPANKAKVVVVDGDMKYGNGNKTARSASDGTTSKSYADVLMDARRSRSIDSSENVKSSKSRQSAATNNTSNSEHAQDDSDYWAVAGAKTGVSESRSSSLAYSVVTATAPMSNAKNGSRGTANGKNGEEIAVSNQWTTTTSKRSRNRKRNATKQDEVAMVAGEIKGG